MAPFLRGALSGSVRFGAVQTSGRRFQVLEPLGWSTAGVPGTVLAWLGTGGCAVSVTVSVVGFVAACYLAPLPARSILPFRLRVPGVWSDFGVLLRRELRFPAGTGSVGRCRHLHPRSFRRGSLPVQHHVLWGCLG